MKRKTLPDNISKKDSHSAQAEKELTADGQRIGKLVLMAEIKKGELLKETEFNKGGRPSNNKTGSTKGTGLKEMGITKRESHWAQEVSRNTKNMKIIVYPPDSNTGNKTKGVKKKPAKKPNKKK